MVDDTPFLPGLSPLQGKAVVARFDGGRLSSEGGLLVLREIERRFGLEGWIGSIGSQRHASVHLAGLRLLMSIFPPTRSIQPFAGEMWSVAPGSLSSGGVSRSC